MEGAYHNTGDFEDLSKSDAVNGNADLDLSFDGFSIQGLFYLPLQAEEIQPYVKAGLYDFDDELSVDGNVTSNSSESGFVVGAGAVMDIADHFSIRADLDWFDADVGDLWAVNLGLQYSFGGSKSAAPVEDAAPAAETGAVEPEPAPMDAALAPDEAVEEAADEPAEEASDCRRWPGCCSAACCAAAADAAPAGGPGRRVGRPRARQSPMIRCATRGGPRP